MFDDSDKTIRVTDFAMHDGAGGVISVQCRIESAGFPERLWFDVTCDDPGAIALDEPNWAAVALMYPAMLAGRDLVIETDLSPRLLHALQGDLQALLLAYDSRLRRIRVTAGAATLPSAIPRSDGVATGFSAGVDSFSTLALYSGSRVPESLRVTHLTVHDVGAFGHTGDQGAAFRIAADRSAAHAATRGLKTLFVRSNLDEIFRAAVLPPTRFQNNHTLRNAAAALLFQNGIDYFLYSSTYPYASISVAARGPQRDTAHLEPMLLPLLSTERLTLISAGAGLTRVEKTALVAGDADAGRLLDVCFGGDAARAAAGRLNCSRCAKCIRTMVTLDLLGKLDGFDVVFDLEHYRQNRRELLRELRRQAQAGSFLDAEVAALARAHGIDLPRPRPQIGGRLVQRLRRAGGQLVRRTFRQ